MTTQSLSSKIVFFILVLISLSGFINSPIALALGIVYALFFKHPYADLSQKAVKWLLKIAVIGLGFGMYMSEALAAGKDGFLLTLFSIITSLGLGYLIGKALKLDKKLSHLIATGTAICGGSAIAAVAPVIRSKNENISIALAVVFILNAIALLLFPYIGHLLDLSQYNFGLWAAIAIHDTSSVVGAAQAYGNEALSVATTVKLARALWIIPVSIISLILFKGKGEGVKIPWFIFLFLLAIIINTYTKFPETLSVKISSISRLLLVLTLFLIGTSLSKERIKSSGMKPMALGIILWLVISISSLIAITIWY